MSVTGYVMNRDKSFHVGRLSPGCEMCAEGAKLVLFVTGLCGRGCVFCPLSEKRRDKDIAWANEREIAGIEDILIEAEEMDALGAGITGGDPILRLERTLEYIHLLKKRFGPGFHIHLYTATPVSKENLQMLKDAGLDEIRFHLTDYENQENTAVWTSIKGAVEIGLDTGVEIPAMPGAEDVIAEIARRLKKAGAGFLNLNELEFSDTNQEQMQRMGHGLKDELSHAASGSEETARKAAAMVSDFNVHFCTSSFKDSVQLKNRLLRRAQRTSKPYETITEEGLLLKGTVTGAENLKGLRIQLMEEYDIPADLIALDPMKMRLETTAEIAVFLAENHIGSGLVYAVVEEYPTTDRLEVERHIL